jgi:non-specific serine/threonine protein kinase
LGVREGPGQPLLTALLAFLRERQLLLILDNCEHLLEACAHLADAILRASSRVWLHATSREALGIDGEVSWRVPSLTVPPSDVPILPATLAQNEAIRLFLERGISVQPAFALTEQNGPFVAQICRQLDGIPLAIELAARRVKTLSVEQIAARLDQRFALLTGGSRTALPRQQTLAALVEWSYDLLSAEEKRFFAYLSVFAGGFTLEAAEALGEDNDVASRVVVADGVVTNTPHLASSTTVNLLTSLVEKSLVVAEGEAGNVERYRLLETLRQYGHERLDTSGETDRYRQRHADFYFELAPRASGFHGPMRRADRDRLEPEIDNFRAALRWYFDSSNVARGLELAASLYNLWWMTGSSEEAYTWLKRFLDHPDASGRTMARSRALQYAGRLAFRSGGVASARALVDEAIEIARELGQHNYAVMLSLALCWVVERMPERELIDEYRFLSGQGGDPPSDESVLAHVARYVGQQGDSAWAQTLAMEGLAIARRTESQYHIAFNLEVLGEVLSSQSEAEARRCLLDSLWLYRAVGDSGGIISIEYLLGRLDRIWGQFGSAVEHFRASLRQANRWGWVQQIAQSVEGLAVVAAATGQPVRALRLAGASDRVRETSSVSVTARERAELDAGLKEAWDALDPGAAEAAWAEGQAMLVDEAIVLALASLSAGQIG